MEPADADVYFGRHLCAAAPATRIGRRALTVYFEFLEPRHRAEIFNLTGRAVEIPLDGMNPGPRQGGVVRRVAGMMG